MFHTPLYGLRADCRQSAGRARWPAHPGYRQNRPQKAPHGDRQDSKAFLSQPSFLSRLGRLVTFRRGGFALARISSDHCQQMCRMQISDRWVGKNCEICGLGRSPGFCQERVAAWVRARPNSVRRSDWNGSLIRAVPRLRSVLSIVATDLFAWIPTALTLNPQPNCAQLCPCLQRLSVLVWSVRAPGWPKKSFLGWGSSRRTR